jgi:hypothetical protein
VKHGPHELRTGEVNTSKITPLKLRLFEHASGAGLGFAGKEICLAVSSRACDSKPKGRRDGKERASRSGKQRIPE